MRKVVMKDAKHSHKIRINYEEMQNYGLKEGDIIDVAIVGKIGDAPINIIEPKLTDVVKEHDEEKDKAIKEIGSPIKFKLKKK